MELYDEPIECEACEGTGGDKFDGRCLSCQGRGLAYEYTCAVCQTTFNIVEHPPYRSHKAYVCKRCALIEAIDERLERIGHALDVHHLNRTDVAELTALVEQLYRVAA